ncbi:hypothetical protein GCM10009648_35870 [Tsukamurella spumae]
MSDSRRILGIAVAGLPLYVIVSALAYQSVGQLDVSSQSDDLPTWILVGFLLFGALSLVMLVWLIRSLRSGDDPASIEARRNIAIAVAVAVIGSMLLEGVLRVAFEIATPVPTLILSACTYLAGIALAALVFWWQNSSQAEHGRG